MGFFRNKADQIISRVNFLMVTNFLKPQQLLPYLMVFKVKNIVMLSRKQ